MPVVPPTLPALLVHPLNICSLSTPPPPFSLPPLLSSSGLISSPLISFVIIHCVLSFLSALQSGRCACLWPLCSLYEIFIYPSMYTCTDMHTHRHTDRPFLYLYFPLGSQTPIKEVFDFPLLVLPRPRMPQRGGWGHEVWGRGRVDTWCPLSLRSINLKGYWGGGRKIIY